METYKLKNVNNVIDANFALENYNKTVYNFNLLLNK